MPRTRALPADTSGAERGSTMLRTLVLLPVLVVPTVLAAPCPDGDGDQFADCAVPGCTPGPTP